MASAQEVIKSFIGVLNKTSNKGTSALDSAVRSVSNFSSWSEVISTMVRDCRAYNGDYEGFLKDMCDIVLDNEDTGAITGSDAGGGSTKTAESIVPEEGDWVYPYSTTFTVQGLEVTVPSKSSLSEAEQFIVGALYTWWIDEAVTLAKNSLGISFNTSGATVKEMDVQFYNRNDGALARVSYNTGMKTTELHLNINMYYYDSIDTSDPNGSGGLNEIVYLDRTIAHEMVHAIMATNVNYFSYLPTSFNEGLAELVHGIDDKRRDSIQSLASSGSSLRTAMNTSTTASYSAGYITLRYLAKQASEDRDPAVDISVTPIVDTDTSISSSTTATSSTTTTSTTTTSTTVVDTTTSTSKTNTTTPSTNTNTSTTETAVSVLSGANYNDDYTVLTIAEEFSKDVWLGVNAFTGEVTEYTNEATVTLDASQQTGDAIILVGNAKNNVIIAGSGGSSLWGGSEGDDTLVGGEGRDMFWFTTGGGKDVAKNFTCGTDETSDILNIQGDLTSMIRNGENFNLTMADNSTFDVSMSTNTDEVIQYLYGENSLRTKIGNASSDDTFTYSSEVDYYCAGGGINTLIVNETDSVEIWLDDIKYQSVHNVTASNSTSDVLIAGDYSDNQIISGQGRSSLWGGNGGNDTLIGGNGVNDFFYGLHNGNDVIQNAGDDDLIDLYDIKLSDLSEVQITDTGIVLKTNDGDSLTVQTTDSPTFSLAEGGHWRYRRISDSWEEIG